MRYGKMTTGTKLSNIALAVTAAAAVLFACVHTQLTKHMEEICEYKGRRTAAQLISEAVDRSLEEDEESCLDITRDDEGKVLSVEADVHKLNDLENKIRQSITDALSEIDDNSLSVPIGTLTGVTALSGRGPDIGIKMHQTGAVDAKLHGEFTDAGVNQTRYTLKIDIKAEMSAILPGHSTDITVEDEYIAAETIIVGELPVVHN